MFGLKYMCGALFFVHAINEKYPSLLRYSQFQDEYSLEQILKSQKIHDPLTKLQCW